MSDFKPSVHQLAIANHLLQKISNLIIRAVAGSGKTTTIVWVYKQIVAKFPSASVLFLAFGAKIAQELNSRGVPALTFNALGWRALKKAYRVAYQINRDKTRDYLRDTLAPEQSRLYAAAAARLVGLAKNAGIGAIVEDSEQAWFDLIDRHDVELEHEQATYPELVAICRRTLEWSSQVSTIARAVDFDDQKYLAVKFGLKLEKFDYVLVDESQDLNAIDRALLHKVLKDDGILGAVGDEAQAIFGFRGAESDSLAKIESEFGCQRLPLTVSYRCAQNVVKYAQRHGAIEASPTAIEGVVRTADISDAVKNAQAGDIILSRTTKPLVQLAYQFLKAHRAAFVLGSEIGRGLTALVNKMKAKGIDALIAKLNAYTDREVEKLIAKGKDSAAEAIRDKTDCVLFLIETLSENDRTVPALTRLIESLFADQGNAIMLSTIHKAKGLEARRVYWLNFDKKIKWARQDWQKQQEENLRYVAATRAKEELVLLPEGGVREEAPVAPAATNSEQEAA